MERAFFRSGNQWLVLEEPVAELIAERPAEVPGILSEVDAAVEDNGLFAAGFVSYEAAAAYGLSVHDPLPGLPAAAFRLYRRAENADRLPVAEVDVEGPARGTGDAWKPLLPRDAYAAAIASIKRYLEIGHSYQVNYTFPLIAPVAGDDGACILPGGETPDHAGNIAVAGKPLFAWFAGLVGDEPPPYAAYLNFENHSILSLSPELFVSLDGRRILSKPMKGTAPRAQNGLGGWRDWEPQGGAAAAASDQNEAAKRLHASEKDRAENLMIVDMIRNDLGRIAEVGSVSVDELFAIETYPTVYQMTSTVSARTDARLPDIFEAMFPCASVTGAPKVRTMEIIRELEPEPRGVYCGAVGFVLPGRRAQFNVAIRTALVDKATRSCRYGVGSGIVWDSSTDAEYDECMVKAAVLNGEDERFRPDGLIESLLLHRQIGYFLLERHIDRLIDSANELGFAWGAAGPREIMAESVREILMDMARDLFEGDEAVEAPRVSPGVNAWKVRLVLDSNGEISCEGEPLDHDPLANAAGPDPGRDGLADSRVQSVPGDHVKKGPWKAPSPRSVRTVIAADPVDPADPSLYLKTTSRHVYNRARETAGIRGNEEVILWNADGLVTEASRSNVVIERTTGDGCTTLVTPPVAFGLLAGTFRGHLLDCGVIEESPITVDELLGAPAVYLINSVRLWRRADLRAGV